MGTRSTIALEFADGTVQQVYCHWDGYLENNGTILRDSYRDPFKVRDLIDMGDMSSLGPDTDSTEFYMRDRNETDCAARKYVSLTEYFEDCQQEEYDYILRQVDGNAVWFVRCYSTDGKWVTMAEAFEAQRKMNECEECE